MMQSEQPTSEQSPPDASQAPISGERATAPHEPAPGAPVAGADHLKELLKSAQPLLQGRLHPLTIVFAIWNAMRRMIIPAVPLLIFGSNIFYGFIFLAALGVTAMTALVRYFSFGYRIEGGELITKQGIIERTERHIRLERVQEVRIEQGVLHRLFGVVDVHVETAGGQGPEASLSVLARAEAERLRQAVVSLQSSSQSAHGADQQHHAEAPGRAVVKQLSLGDLVLAGLSSNHLVSALVLVGTLWAFVDDILPEGMYERFARTVYRSMQDALEQGTQAALVVALLIITVVLAASLLFSVLGSIVLFYGFTLSRSGGDLHRAYGLLTRRSSSLPQRRIQVLEVEEGILRRLFGLATLRADTAGSRSEERGEERRGRDVLLPVVRRGEVERLLPVFLPELETGSWSWNRVSRLAVRRGTIKGAILCVMLAIGTFYLNRSAMGLWPLALLPLVYLFSLMRYHNLGYSLGERYFLTRRGWLSRSTHIVPIRNAQAIVVRQSPFDRRYGLASLEVDTAGQAYTGGGPRISNLPVEEARLIARALSQKAAATRYRW